MVTRALINEFLAQKTLGLVGVSRHGKGFGNAIRNELTRKGYVFRLVHPEADSIEDQPCVKALNQIAHDISGLVLVTPPTVTLQLLYEAVDVGIRRVWIQQGAESEEVIKFCDERGLLAVYRQCIFMFAEPTGFPHRLHRGIRAMFGRLPK